MKNPATIFRSINHEYDGQPMFTYEKGYYDHTFQTVWRIDPILGDNPMLYSQLFDSQLNNKRETIKSIDPKTSYNGKIFVAEINMTMVDGTSEAESKGLIDINDCPPIDTWFYLGAKDYPQILFAWIPESYIELANNAIEVNCVDCIYWYIDISNSKWA